MRSLFAFVALLVAPLSAQVCVTGIVEPVTGPTVCMQGETHRLACTQVFLKSASVDLRRYEGQNVHVAGREIGLTCDVIEVTRVDPARARLEWCGSGSTGCPLKVKVCPVGMGRYWTFLGLAPDFRPFGCGATGWIDGALLVRDPILPLSSGGAGLCGELVIGVPLDNSLVGLEVWFQGVRQDIGPVGPLELTNVGSVRIAPFMPPCAPTSC